jgi:PAS domain S-box-containing protein
MFDIDYLFDKDKFQGVVLLLNKNLVIQKVNQRFLMLQGYTEDDILDTSILDIVLPTDKSTFFDVTYSLDLKKEFVCQIYHKSGAFRFYSFTAVKLKDYIILFGNAEKKEFHSYHYDNKEQLLRNEIVAFDNVDDISQVLKQNDTVIRFLDIFPSDVWVKDKIGRYIYCNKAFEKHTGHTLGKIKGKDDFQLFSKAIATEFTSSDKITIKNKKEVSYVFETKEDNLPIYTTVTKIPIFNQENDYIGMVSYSTDITEFKNIEIKLRKRLASFKKCVDHFYDYAFSLSKSSEVHSLHGKLVNEDNFQSIKKQLHSLFNIELYSEFREDLILLDQGKTIMKELLIKDEKILFHLLLVKDEEETNILFLGNKSEALNDE